MDEIWKDIEGFEGLYQVSNLGRVKCVEHKCPGRHGLRTVKEHLMTQVKGSKGYFYVSLSNMDRGRTFTVHRLVARAFIPNPDNLPYVNHIDENPSNPNVNNLEWCTEQYNVCYGSSVVRTAKSKWRKVIQYDKDMNEIARFDSLKAASEHIGIAQQNISAVCRGKAKYCGGFLWKYEDDEN